MTSRARDNHGDFIVERAAWMDDAACKGMPARLFHPERGESTRPAKKVCATCPVVTECLDYAMTQGAARVQGVLGGLSDNQRRHLRAELKAAA